MIARSLSVAFFFGTLIFGGTARAEMFVGRSPSPKIREIRMDALLVDRGEAGFTLVQRASVRNSETLFLWLQPVPGVPEQAAVSFDPFGPLAQTAVPVVPFSDQLREVPLGPSLATVLLRRLTTERPTRKALVPPAGRSLEIGELQVFQGRAHTSTITRETFLPGPLEEFLRRYGTKLSSSARHQAGDYLNRDWSILGVALIDPAPSPDDVVSVGPVALRFQAGSPSFPLLRRGALDAREVVIHILADGPRVPVELPIESARPDFVARTAPRGQVFVTFAGALERLDSVDPQLAEQFGLRSGAGADLTQLYLRPGTAKLDVLTFASPSSAVRPLRLESQTTAGSAQDLLTCILLGLAPLFLAPESWLLWWIEGRARQVARKGGSWVGVKLWSFWPFLVAAYWFFGLEGMARIAAIGPLVIGTVQLAIPFSEREAGPIRVQFRRRTKEQTEPATTARARR